MLRALARLRVPLGFVFGLLVLWLARPTARTLFAGALIALVGQSLRVWAAGHLEKGREVTSSGPYAFTRHPLYLGSGIIALGLMVAAANVWVAVVVLAYLAATYTAAIRTEEAHLTEKFGPAYPDYRAGKMSVRRPFSLRRAMVTNREYRSALGVLAVLAVLWWKVG